MNYSRASFSASLGDIARSAGRAITREPLEHLDRVRARAHDPPQHVRRQIVLRQPDGTERPAEALMGRRFALDLLDERRAVDAQAVLQRPGGERAQLRIGRPREYSERIRPRA